MPKRHDETQPIRREISPGIHRLEWEDGTPLTDQEVAASGNVQQNHAINWGKDINQGFDDLSTALGFNPKIIDENAPGGALQTAAADAQRERTQGFIDQLTQQAATGDGAWQQRFAEAVRGTQNAAMALGQSNPDMDQGAALMNIGNAQSGARQRAVGDEKILREQSKMNAQGQLADVLGSQAQMDLAQSAEAARVARERQAVNLASIEKTQENRKSTESAVGGGLMSMAGGMSDGGEVPGRAPVFGNDERNDTVPAWLSPKEIVIPRDIAMAPDAPEQAARFVAAVKAGHDPQAGGGSPPKMAEGGGIKSGKATDLGPEGWMGYFINPQMGREMQYGQMRGKYGGGEGSSIDPTQYNQTAAQQDQLAALFAGSAIGSGPSIVPMVTTQRMGNTLGSAQAAQVRGGAPQADVLKGAAIAGGETAAKAGEQTMREQSAGQGAYGDILRQRRAQDMQAASANQQAGISQTMVDLGLSLKQQAELRNALGAAGQSAAAFSGIGKGERKRRDGALAGSDAYSADLSGERGGYADLSQDDPEFKAYGGVVGMSEGGIVARGPNGEKLYTDKQAEELRRDYEEESDDEGANIGRKRRKPDEKESAFARAVRGVAGFMRKGATSARGMAEGGGVPMDGGRPPFDPYVFDAQRGAAPTQPVVYVSPTPVPGTQPVAIGGAGGGGGSDTSAGGASGQDMPQMGGAGGAGGASGAVQADRGSGGATGGPSGSQIPQHEAIQPRAERPAQAPALPAGVTPRGTQAPAMPPTPVATPAATHGAKMTPRPSGAGADELARKAAMAGYEAENQAATAGAENAAAEASAIETQMNERKALVDRTQAKVAEAQTRYQRAVDEMERVDTSVDPGRFWATRTTGDKVMGILGLVLGAMGAGPDGINRAAVMLNDAVNRDLEAQKSEHELRLKKGGAKLNAAQNFYAMARDIAGDEVAAFDLASAAAMRNVAAKGKALMARTQDAEAKARLATVIAGIEQGAAQRSAAAWEKSADRALEREKIAAHAKGAGGLPAAEQSKAIEVRERTADIKRNIAKAREIIQRSGTSELLGTDETELKRALGDIAQDSARLKDPNSTVKDQELVNAKRAIGVEGGEIISLRNNTALKLLDSFEQTMMDREAEALRVRGLAR